LEFSFLGSDFGVTVLGILQLGGEGVSFGVTFTGEIEENAEAESAKNGAQCDRHHELRSKSPKKFLQMKNFPKKSLTSL
jgi:hypothetical protein